MAEREHDLIRLSREKYADFHNQSRLEYQKAAKEHGAATIKLLVLLNGGAVLALLTFLGSLFARAQGSALDVIVAFAHDASRAMYEFSLGLFLAAVTSAIAYLNFLVGERSFLNEHNLYLFIQGKELRDKRNFAHILTNILLWIAIFTAVSSFVFFIRGVLISSDAFRAIGG